MLPSLCITSYVKNQSLNLSPLNKVKLIVIIQSITRHFRASAKACQIISLQSLRFLVTLVLFVNFGDLYLEGLCTFLPETFFQVL